MALGVIGNNYSYLCHYKAVPSRQAEENSAACLDNMSISQSFRSCWLLQSNRHCSATTNRVVLEITSDKRTGSYSHVGYINTNTQMPIDPHALKQLDECLCFLFGYLIQSFTDVRTAVLDPSSSSSSSILLHPGVGRFSFCLDRWQHHCCKQVCVAPRLPSLPLFSQSCGHPHKALILLFIVMPSLFPSLPHWSYSLI